ncbi:ABC transporter substrate-binding protein [Microbulbifer thermotolerans]|uniref:ABC transporter substrate-binding protein n=1 Tax=Microbulbifer thermotolerans TaxID=252514 RepID=A0A143HMD6_MICTH|nr:ABC transporter substrate-binding protein [Microbulbifer thermotolerans]AMX02885.1 ABC transporter substrate-binding protein [Microbulbifer thermotolerans]MCX2784089.1 ABC transporter substrate-binding protein [Microbulbifer thermotolerans]MCX2794858.1 ABC transporter substrate-binding protein [Microbulbifer thermotolerans]MCX2803050.1 ABC transporter substrate-binding protein [Microbulbifer thermotolerans]MCX2831046.1 ABC transporter substrate-binding protein [Microbulbifer thermotolerans]
MSSSDSKKITLHGMTWDHTRGYTPLVAAAQRFEELNPNISIRWDKRSLQAFADHPIDDLAARYDLLVIDHPWTGFAAKEKVILPLDEHLPREFLQDQADNAVGESHNSYHYDGQQWALALDAATPVASLRPDLLQKAGVDEPKTWEDLMSLAERGLVAVPSIPQDTLMNFYMLCSAMGEDPCTREEEVVSNSVGVEALAMLKALSDQLDRRCFDWNPIKVYEAMTLTDDFAYCPFAYGYANYAQPGYARKTLEFRDTVTAGPNGEHLKTTLGGTGLAISAHTRHPEIAAQFVAFTGDPDFQASFYIQYGGQPGHRRAWINETANRMTNNYFVNTLPTLDRAFLRPRYHGHMYFQDNAGAPIRDYLMHGGDAQALLQDLNKLYIKSRQG